ncbi:TetR/AcrR family transcriptional regulator [Pseudomaricurvus sp.]|uniref:TetR/AcrR family transcriptional regulator n=1 Tax=Pseudomaricurvus sp. TaxID=2004510 RepID=UPI003F6BB2C1
MNTEAQPATPQDRMSADERRNDLIDLALEILREEGAEKVSIGTIASRAGVTRTLVYKHFTNREDLVNATYSREADKLHNTISLQVNQATGFEDRLRAFVGAVIGAVDTHGWMFGPQEVHTQEEGFKVEQSRRDRRTVKAFAELASDEFGLSRREATSAMGILLSGITSLRIQAHVLNTHSDRQFLADLYMDLTLSALSGLKQRRTP